MTANRLLGNLLKFKGWRVDWFEFEGASTLKIGVKPYKNGCCCPDCGRRCPIVWALTEPREWRDVPICGRTLWLVNCPREVLCPTHGRVQEALPWAASWSRVTYRFEYLMLRYAQSMTQKMAATLLHVAASTLSDLLHRSITRLRDGHRIRGLKTLGVDEIAYAKGHKYATLAYDLDRARVVWIGQGKGRKTIDEFFNKTLSPEQKRQILWASCDMSRAYIGAIKHHCRNATLVLDRFHVVKALNAAVDDVRKQQWGLAARKERKLLKGLRWLLYRHPRTRTRQDTRALRTLEKGNRRIYRAWRLKDEFESFWNYQAPWAAERFLKRWMTAALRSRLAPLRGFVKLLSTHYAGILAFVGSRLTNAVAEGINRIVQIVKNRASGFRTLEAFSDLIFLTVGDFDIPAQIPLAFRTL